MTDNWTYPKLRPAFFSPSGNRDGANRNAVIEPVEMPHGFQRTKENLMKTLKYVLSQF
jgi:hypothetical protein